MKYLKQMAREIDLRYDELFSKYTELSGGSPVGPSTIFYFSSAVDIMEHVKQREEQIVELETKILSRTDEAQKAAAVEIEKIYTRLIKREPNPWKC